MTTQTGKTHLEFYRQHQIAPVRYDLNDMDMHLERRMSLYMKLGLHPLAFRSSRVLEVAAGTGHNSLYLAHLLPAKLVLLEPNAVGVEHIREVYNAFQNPHTSPEVITSMLEEYVPAEDFDIVLCENWLGNSQHELSLLQKLSHMVASQGALVVTTVSPIGFVPNLLRRFFSAYIAPLHQGFNERTDALIQAYGSHLDTLASMTRNKIDWVHDNMINPAYFGLALSIPLVIEQLGDRFEVMGASPSLAEDWRWFKGLFGQERKFNEHFLSEYWSKAHNFLDYRQPTTVRDPALNIELEKKALELLKAIEMHEEAHIHNGAIVECVGLVASKFDEFLAYVPSNAASMNALHDIQKAMSSLKLGKLVADMKAFSSLFGRETVYLSLHAHH